MLVQHAHMGQARPQVQHPSMVISHHAQHHHMPQNRHLSNVRKAFSPVKAANPARHTSAHYSSNRDVSTLSMSGRAPSYKQIPVTSTASDMAGTTATAAPVAKAQTVSPAFINQRILCYGDSLTAGLAGNFVKTYAPYSKRLSELLSCPVDHVGLCGRTTSDMVRIRNDDRAVDVKQNVWHNAGLALALRKAKDEGNPYTAVVILAGTNDLGSSSPRQIVDNLMTLHRIVRSSGAVSVACAVPKHGALVCKEYSKHLNSASRDTISSKIDMVNRMLKERIAKANQDADCGVVFVDPHSDVLGKAGTRRAETFAGYPTLGEFNEFHQIRNDGKENASVPINQTMAGQHMKRTQPQVYGMLEDALHFSPGGYRSFAESLSAMCKSHLLRLS